MRKAILCLGTNIGNRLENLKGAIEALSLLLKLQQSMKQSHLKHPTNSRISIIAVL